MWITKVKVAAALVLAVSVLSAGGGLIAYRALAAGPQAQGPEAQSAASGKTSADTRHDDELRKALDRIAVLEKQLSDYRKRLEQSEAELQIARYISENPRRDRQSKKTADQPPVPGRVSDPFSTEIRPPELKKPTSEAERRLRADAEQRMQEEIELLEAQLEAKQAELRAAKAGVEAAKLDAARVSDLVKKGFNTQGELGRMQQDMAAREAQVLVKAAEIKEPEIRLKQARRRLAALQGSKEQTGRAGSSPLEQRVRELEEKVKVMDHDLARLKKVVRPE